MAPKVVASWSMNWVENYEVSSLSTNRVKNIRGFLPFYPSLVDRVTVTWYLSLVGVATYLVEFPDTTVIKIKRNMRGEHLHSMLS